MPADETKKGERRPRPLLRRALHGEVTLAGAQHRALVFQRGQVTGVSKGSITVRSQDDYTARYVLNADLRVRRAKQEASLTDAEVGTQVRILASKDGSTLTARRLVLVT